MDNETERWLTECDARGKSNTHRIDKLEKRQDNLEELVGTVKVLADRQERVENDLKEIKTDVKTLAEKPGKRWDGIVSQIIAIIVAAVAGFILAQIGL